MVLDKEKQGNILFPRRNMDFTEMFKKANMDGSDREGAFSAVLVGSIFEHFPMYSLSGRTEGCAKQDCPIV